jgi:pimeloyl-ACP methyl ester carboxylesterase
MVSAYAALAPVAYVGHVDNLAIRALADLDVAEWLTLFGAKDFLPQSDIIMRAFPLLCKLTPAICEDFLLYIMGYDPHDIDRARLPEYVSFDPAGTSVLNMHHWSQGIRSDKFQMFDYGSAEANARHYNGSATPPAYSLGDYPSEAVPLALFAGGRDNLADPKDVARMRQELPQPFAYHEYPEYSHISFVWGTDAAKDVYPDVQAHLFKHAVV